MAVSAIAADLAAGFGLLTRLPVGWLVPRGALYRPGRAAWTYPLAGLVVGGAAAAIFAGVRWAGLPPLPAAAWAVAGAVLLTGGLHEDGLADTADGFGGGRTPERRLEIMRDSRIGSYGTLALVLSLAIRIAGIGAMAPTQAGIALLVTGALSRAAILPLLLLPPARTDGLSQGLGRVPPISLLTGGALAVVAALSLLPPARALEAVAGTLLVVAATAVLARRRIGGQTGDVLGAAAAVTECLLLSLLAT